MHQRRVSSRFFAVAGAGADAPLVHSTPVWYPREICLGSSLRRRPSVRGLIRVVIDGTQRLSGGAGRTTIVVAVATVVVATMASGEERGRGGRPMRRRIVLSIETSPKGELLTRDQLDGDP